MGTKASLEGHGDIIAKLESMSVNVANVENEALEQAGETIRLEAIEMLKVPTPHHVGKTYFMAASARDGNNSPIIEGMKKSKVIKGRKSGRYIRVYNEDHAASLTEYGHSGDYAPPHPFLAPAFERKKSEANKIIEDILIGALSK